MPFEFLRLVEKRVLACYLSFFAPACLYARKFFVQRLKLRICFEALLYGFGPAACVVVDHLGRKRIPYRVNVAYVHVEREAVK